uniref:Uncharacterized protein n=1 Tax=Oryza sativa subsp. japonica TaxID=39947 RepID=Q7EYF4_ORYSJ|nr:hypothetical protein [Oryza sativa Japonica Group]BAD30274.1 hypothetical protein [Oryza sativa Japonica Group]
MRRIYATRVRTSTATYGGQIDGGRRRHSSGPSAADRTDEIFRKKGTERAG